MSLDKQDLMDLVEALDFYLENQSFQGEEDRDPFSLLLDKLLDEVKDVQ